MVGARVEVDGRSDAVGATVGDDDNSFGPRMDAARRDRDRAGTMSDEAGGRGGPGRG